ncbi:DPH4-like [Oopsacas minuta]|uniref:DPH4-like n=1 Tax=Oopsacas minuta TaxID=111878 RepID=A0AAV7JCR6_9METZ|nr:DPH4-like [Oopsacas minuta]
MSNPYHVLGISILSDTDRVKRAYKQLVLRSHPDKYPKSTNFLEIQQAYEILIDPIKKSIIDRQLQTPHAACQETIKISDMECLETGEGYTYPCRCGGEYVLEADDVTGVDEELIIPCTTCTLMLRVQIFVS